MIESKILEYKDFRSRWYNKWFKEYGIDPSDKLNRKYWEWAIVSEILDQKGFLKFGSLGLGFGVGKEPLANKFSEMHCGILATDKLEKNCWRSTNQQADPESFNPAVQFVELDMTKIPVTLRGYDFCWSCCSMEHIGGLKAGEKFLFDSLDCLRKGGLAVHTTEYNINSNERTVESKNLAFYRRKDLEEIQNKLVRMGYITQKLDYSKCIYPHILGPEEAKLRARVGSYVATSAVLVIRKGEKQ